MKTGLRSVKARRTHDCVLIFAITFACCVCYTFPREGIAEQPPSEKIQKTETNWLSKTLGIIEIMKLGQQLRQLYEQTRYTEAVPVAEELLSTVEKAFGPEDPAVVGALNTLAVVYHACGKYERIESLLKRALKIGEKEFGPEHPVVATTLNNLATLYRDIGEYEKAEPLFRRALTIREKVLGLEHPDVAVTLNNQAALYYALGEYTKAGASLERTLAIQEKTLGSEHFRISQTLNNLATLYYALEPLHHGPGRHNTGDFKA